jgi:hypothetical protein
MHLNILNNVKSFDDHTLSSIEEVVEEQQKKTKRMLTFIDTITKIQ